MKNELNPYECQFTIDERKTIISQTIQEFRKANKYTQKQVAAFIKVKPTTYNTYESGRTEPPAEILVRLSYLYKVPIDTLVQKERTYKTAADLVAQMQDYKAQLGEIDEILLEQLSEDEASQYIRDFRDSMYKMVDALQTIATQDKVKIEIEKPMNKD